MRLIRWINASAGTGKTHKIKELIDLLVSSNTNPSSILCLTFTTAGANEMRHRYLQSHDGNGKIPRFETIHSFANSLSSDGHNIIDEDTSNNLIQEAMEFVLLDEMWANFFELIYPTWETAIADIKQIVLSGLPIKDNFLQNYINKHFIPPKIGLSQESVKALNDSGLSSLIPKIMSNDFEIYSTSFVTKELKLSKRILPQSFLNNPNYEVVNAELKNIFQNILRYVLDLSNSDHLRQSLTCNIFIRQIATAYQNLKKMNNLMDFNDMIHLAINKIKESSESVMHIKHIFLDEAQDTSDLQWKLIYNLVLEVFQAEEVSFTVVGDKKQIIYQFNGASKSLYDRMKIKCQGILESVDGTWDEISLDKSYRTSQTILNFVDTVMESTSYGSSHTAAIDKKGYVKTWLPLAANKDHLIVNKGWTIPEKQSVPEWASLCVEEINKLIGKQKLLNQDRLVEPQDIAILVPRRCIHNFLLTEQLKRAKIPVKNVLFGMYADETVQDLISAASVVIDVRNDLMMSSLLKSLYFGWSNSEIEELLINREDTVWTTLLSLNQPKVQFAINTIQEWLTFPKDLLSFYSKLIFHTEFGKCLLENFRHEVLAFWEKVISLSKFSLSEFLFHLQNTYEPMRSNKNGISILTTHASKGQEFNIVFLLNPHLSANRNAGMQIIYDNMFLLKGNYELYRTARNRILLEQENESDRLLYVALTRAREQLYILPPLSTDNINPKSWYSRIIKNINIFERNGDEYELISKNSKLKMNNE
jgi:ATP-dependent helicase/nuclease subunit A